MTVPPPPPPPRPASAARAARRIPSWVPWALLVAATAAVVAVAAVLASSGGDPAAGVISSATAPSTTAPPPSTSTSTTTTLPTASTSTSTTPTLPEPTTTTTTPPGKPPYSAADLSYFRQIAGQAEFGGGSGVVHRWDRDVLIEVRGDPLPGDREALDAVVADLNEILDPIEVVLVGEGGNVELTFAPREDFPAIEPNYEPGNDGFVWIWWDGRGAVTSATVLISTTGTDPAGRSHLLREELTQSLGLLNDSWEYEDSIFYQGWTTTQSYSPIDTTVVEMLYRPELHPGMGIDEAVAVLAALEGD